MKLNIGAGSTRYDGFVNCDYDDQYNPEYVFDIEKDKWPFDDNSIDSIIAHHVLEHLGEGYFHALKELYRVCKHDAIIDIRVPHHRHDNFLHDPTHRRPITVYGLTLFSKKYNDECVASNIPSSRLGYFLNVDFEIVDHHLTLNSDHPQFEHIQRMNGEELRRFAYDRTNVYDETCVKLKVVKS